MAVVIASDLAKDMAGEPLLRGVSFRLERRERLTLSGRNGSGKTTLLRMLAGESSVDGGELVLAKGTRVALHDQRPPRDRDLSLRDYVLSGAKELLAIETRLAVARSRRHGLGDCGSQRSAPGEASRSSTTGKSHAFPRRATSLRPVDDDAIRTLVTRLSRPHASGGEVIERAAILAEGADSAAVLTWIAAHAGEPEDLAPRVPGRGLHSARLHDSDGANPRTPLRYVLPPGALS